MLNKLLYALLCLCVFAIPMNAENADKILSLLKQELNYNYGQLSKQTVKPYFMSYRLEDRRAVVISSSMGVTKSDNEDRQCTITPQVRIGDAQLDNFKYNTQGLAVARSRQVPAVTVPFEGNITEGVKANIWSATLQRYDYALGAYQQAKSKAATSAADEDKAPCFSKAPVETYYEAPLPESQMRIDRKAWEQRLNAVSAIFKAEPLLQEGLATLNFEVSRTWLVNTEGTSVVQNRVTARVMLQIRTQADDGMQLPLMQDFFAFSPDSLPSQNVMIAAAKDLLKRVIALRNAPVANPYTGPAILSGPASGVFFHEIFGHRLEGHRLKQGGETFRKMINQPVLPESFQVFCDPTLKKYHGQDLNGYYLYDSEGVKARRVNNVVNGVLKEFLMSRVPLDGFPQSNGHGRASGANDAVSRQSNLCVETNSPITETKMRAELRNECRKQGKEYGYYFKTVTSGYTMTGEQGSINSFNVTPVEVYRIYVDGRPDELVRGVSLIGTPLSMFSHIKYGGDTPSTFTGVCGAESGWVPVTANSPAIFVTQIETQRVNKAQGTPPILKAPSFDNHGDASLSESEIILRAMKDEQKRSFDSLQIAGVPRTAWIDYMTNRYRTVHITGELGGVSQKTISPWMTSVVAHTVLGNFKRSSDVVMQPMIVSTGADNQIDYSQLRRSFWMLTDVTYKNSVNMMAQKQNFLLQHPLPSALEKIPDMQRSAPITYMENTKAFNIDYNEMSKEVSALSSIFNKYDKLFGTQVDCEIDEITSYRTTTENVNIETPHNRLGISVRARFRDEDNNVLDDAMILAYQKPEEIPSEDSLKSMIKSFADNCMELRNAPILNEYYKGPVMYTGEAVRRIFINQYLRPNMFFAQQMMEMPKSSLGEKLGKKIMDERFTIKNLTGETSFNGKPLYGHYSVDADGFKPAEEMVIVDKGVFKMMLNRTTPALYAEKSTASSRLVNNVNQSVPMVGVGTLFISADGVTPEQKMEKELLKIAKKKKLDYAYIVSAPENCSTLRIYRISVKTGERELMKANQIKLPTIEQMNNVKDISSESNVKNMVTPYTYSIVYPRSIIVDDVELNKSSFKPAPVDPIPYPLLRDEK